MRRQDIKLLALARSGDTQARVEVARRYLTGTQGFPRHLPSGIEHLSAPNVRSLPAAAEVVAECLALDDILRSGLMGSLEQAVRLQLGVAQLKLGVWLQARHAGTAQGQALLESAAAQGVKAAAEAMAASRRVQRRGAGASLAEGLSVLARHGHLDAGAVALVAGREALASGDLRSAGVAIAAAIALCGPAHPELGPLVVDAVQASELAGQPLASLDASLVEPILEARATSGDTVAAYALGRALCGIGLGVLPPDLWAEGTNMRKGAALLLRAADGGCDEAWLHLYRLHADNRLSVANPQMARFFLEKSAARGAAEAQRRLGALMLRSATTLHDSEQAISWLHQASAQGDPHAAELLQSLVLPLEGSDADAEQVIAAVTRVEPWLAARLRIAREFGLTKLEALCFDPVQGLRPWGLVVGKNPFISQIRLSAPRAIPALRPGALGHLRTVAQLFSAAAPDANRFEGDLRRRSLVQRRVFTRLEIDESMFFATASSVALDALRQGPKWAFRVREPLRMALAEQGAAPREALAAA